MNKSKIVSGQFNEATVFTTAIDGETEDQIRLYLDHPDYADSRIRIMPDVHVGKGTVVGFTATIPGKISPHTIGVDIGCGVSAWKLGRLRLSADKLDKFIRKRIPFGTGSFDRPIEKERMQEVYERHEGTFCGLSFKDFWKRFHSVCEERGIDRKHALRSLGTLGSGNHFIELAKDEEKNHWLTIHSGSRGFGYKLAEYHQDVAVRVSDNSSNLKFLEGELADLYLEDTKLAQDYARLNRRLMGDIIRRKFFKVKDPEADYVDSVHNYISFRDNIVRKGAISAHEGERVIIPFSMADGAVVGLGKGNGEWNFSAPHGSGRRMSRKKARESLDIDRYRKVMRGVWTSCIAKDTLSESPMAYKKATDILAVLDETINVQHRLMPVYNFKGGG